MSRWAILSPFGYKEFRYLFSAEVGNQTAIWFTAFLLGLLIKDLKGNTTFYEGLVGFAFNVPFLLFSLMTGVLGAALMLLVLFGMVTPVFLALLILYTLFIRRIDCGIQVQQSRQ